MKYSKEIKVGLSLAIAAVVFFAGLRFFQDIPIFKSSYMLRAEFEDASGLVQGNPVRMKGVSIGTVESVVLDHGDQLVKVIFRVEEDVKIPQESYAEVTGFSALSGVRLSIVPGPPGNPPVEPGTTLQPPPKGGVLERLSDQAPVLATKADSVLSNANVALGALGKKLDDPSSDLNEMIAALEQTTRQLQRATDAEAIQSTLRNLEAITADLERFTGESEADQDTLAANNLGKTMARLNRSLDKLDRNLANLEQSTQALGEITTKMNEGDGTMARMLNDSSLYVRLDSTAGNANRLLEDLRENPDKYLEDMTLVKVF
jgi:phospholipid/cholesterol/gamma-HCH transport system substrate-binding protein